jgi:hypothetical protein
MNTLRIVLVGLTVIAAIAAFVVGQVQAGVYLTAACLIHGALWWVMAKRRAEEHAELHAGVEQLLREEA